MRKLLVSVTCVCVLAPAALAFAAEDNQQDDRDGRAAGSIAAIHPSSKAEPLDQARLELDEAAERVKNRQEAIRERQLERQAALEAAAAAEAAAVEAPVPTEATPPGGAPSGQLGSIAQCESGGDPGAVSPDGQYHGLYQFDQSTWESVGGSGSPSAASAAEQTARAQTLMGQSGTSPWPSCGG